MSDLLSWLVMIALLGWLIGYAITAARRQRYIQTLKYIHIFQGKHGPFRNQVLKGFSRLRQEKLIAAAARARAAAPATASVYCSPNPTPSSSLHSPPPPE